VLPARFRPVNRYNRREFGYLPAFFFTTVAVIGGGWCGFTGVYADNGYSGTLGYGFRIYLEARVCELHYPVNILGVIELLAFVPGCEFLSIFYL
jgi:hypothetical protein